MKSMFVVIMVVMACLALAVPAISGEIKVNQSQSYGVTQNQASFGGFSTSAQGYSAVANQGYVITKSPAFLSPASGIAVGSTSTTASGGQAKFGSGFQSQGMLGGATNSGSIHY